MSNYTSRYIAFAKDRMHKQSKEIREWAKPDTPLLAEVCREILEAEQEQGAEA